MAWKMTVAGTTLNAPLLDEIVEFIQETLGTLAGTNEGAWIQIGDQSEEGAQRVYLTASTPIVLTRLPNDPNELLYKFHRG